MNIYHQTSPFISLSYILCNFNCWLKRYTTLKIYRGVYFHIDTACFIEKLTTLKERFRCIAKKIQLQLEFPHI